MQRTQPFWKQFHTRWRMALLAVIWLAPGIWHIGQAVAYTERKTMTVVPLHRSDGTSTVLNYNVPLSGWYEISVQGYASDHEGTPDISGRDKDGEFHGSQKVLKLLEVGETVPIVAGFKYRARSFRPEKPGKPALKVDYLGEDLDGDFAECMRRIPVGLLLLLRGILPLHMEKRRTRVPFRS